MKFLFNVCITCIGGYLIRDIIDSLHDAHDFDVLIIGVDANPSAHGRLLCDRFEVLPVAEEDEFGYIDSILKIHEDIGIDVLITLSEGESRVVARYRDRLIDAGIRVSVSNSSTVEIMTDKLMMLQHMDKNHIDAGLFVPINNNDDVKDALKFLGYPEEKVVLKPRKSAGSRGVIIYDSYMSKVEYLLEERFCISGSFDDIEKELSNKGIVLANFIATPYYDGPVFDVECIAINGKVTDMAARKRQLKNPLSPISTGHKVDMNSNVLAFAKKLCLVFNVNGSADFDIVLNDIETPRLLDSGARFSGSVGGSYIAGANFMAQLVRVLMEVPYKPLEIRNNCILRPFVSMSEIPKDNEKDFL
jgi:carbamoyl-phosphate synthase large subunit